MKFSLRTFLICTTVLTVVFGYFALQYQSSQGPIKRIRSLGGYVYHGDDFMGSFCKISEAFYPTNIAVRFDADLSIEVAKEIAKLKKIDWLDVDGIQTNEDAWRVIAELDSVNHLSVDNADDAFFERIAKLKGLKRLRIGGKKVKGTGIQWILKHKDLTTLNLSYSNVDDSVAATISQMEGLEELYLTGTYITDKGVAQMSELPNLRVLFLNETDITGACIGDLAKLTSLRQLAIGVGGFPYDTTKLVEPLAHLKLEFLELPWLFLDDANVPEVQALFPECEMRWKAASQRLKQIHGVEVTELQLKDGTEEETEATK